MSGDEVSATLVSTLLAVVVWGLWHLRLAWVNRSVEAASLRMPLYFAPTLSILGLLALLMNFAASDVRDAPEYLFMYTAMGAAWVAVLVRTFQLLGISARDDVAERGNRAAVPAIIGLIFGGMLAFAGGNFGDGPGWWVVVFSSGLATLMLVLAWIVLNATAQVCDHITIDRDRASGWRIGLLFVAIGAVAGRGAAGTWVSAGATVADFATIGLPPAIALIVYGVVLERLLKPHHEEPPHGVVLHGFFPGIVALAIAAADIYLLGMWT